jgi:hypothetical protein
MSDGKRSRADEVFLLSLADGLGLQTTTEKIARRTIPQTSVVRSGIGEALEWLRPSGMFSRTRTAVGEGMTIARARKQGIAMGLPNTATTMYRVKRGGNKKWVTRADLTGRERRRRGSLKQRTDNPLQRHIEDQRMSYREAREPMDNPAAHARREERRIARETSAQDREAKRLGKEETKNRFGNKNLAMVVGGGALGTAGLLGGTALYRKKRAEEAKKGGKGK